MTFKHFVEVYIKEADFTTVQLTGVHMPHLTVFYTLDLYHHFKRMFIYVMFLRWFLIILSS
jgi:hypothetical protein